MQMPLSPSVRRAAAALPTLALLIAGALVLSNVSEAGVSRSAGRLVLMSKDPVTLSGRGFRPRVHVHVRLVTTRVFSRTPLANRHGAFTITFPAVIDRCSAWSVSAGQPESTTVVLRSPAKPGCAPASTP
jgi:hypothetical protein